LSIFLHQKSCFLSIFKATLKVGGGPILLLSGNGIIDVISVSIVYPDTASVYSFISGSYGQIELKHSKVVNV
jgi:hypothetical protein